MRTYQTWFFEGDFDSQVAQREPVEKFMKTQGYAVAWTHTRINGSFVVFFREDGKSTYSITK